MKCPHCKQSLLQKDGEDTKVRIKGKMVISGDHVCKAQCFWCGKPVVLPIGLKKSQKYVIGANRSAI